MLPGWTRTDPSTGSQGSRAGTLEYRWGLQRGILATPHFFSLIALRRIFPQLTSGHEPLLWKGFSSFCTPLSVSPGYFPWHSGPCGILALLICLATFNVLGFPNHDTCSHLWAFVQAIDSFYLKTVLPHLLLIWISVTDASGFSPDATSSLKPSKFRCPSRVLSVHILS